MSLYWTKRFISKKGRISETYRIKDPKNFSTGSWRHAVVIGEIAWKVEASWRADDENCFKKWTLSPPVIEKKKIFVVCFFHFHFPPKWSRRRLCSEAPDLTLRFSPKQRITKCKTRFRGIGAGKDTAVSPQIHWKALILQTEENKTQRGCREARRPPRGARRVNTGRPREVTPSSDCRYLGMVGAS